MKVLAIKDFPENVKGMLKALAALRGMTIKELVILLVENEWKKDNNEHDAPCPCIHCLHYAAAVDKCKREGGPCDDYHKWFERKIKEAN